MKPKPCVRGVATVHMSGFTTIAMVLEAYHSLRGPLSVRSRWISPWRAMDAR